jgi:DNA polymerase III subunit beta
MELRIERSALADAVTWAARSLPTRSPVPVLGGLLLDASAGRLRVAGFDYEASAVIEVPADVAADGQVLVPGRRLLDICRVLPEAQVSCALVGARFAMEGPGTRFGMSTLPRAEYPALPALPPFCGEVDAVEFADAVAQVVIAAGRDETLPVLTGIQVRLDEGAMTLAASDRYRYAVRTLPWRPDATAPEAGAGLTAVVVPDRRLAEVARALAKSGRVRIGLGGAGGGGLMAFEGGGMRTTLRLLDGRLPCYEKLFTLESPAVAITGREALAEAVRRVAVVAEPNSPVRLDFSARGTVLLQAGYEDDVASQQLPVVLTGADEMTVAFNPSYLLEALNSFTASRVRFDLMGPGQRALLSGAAPADDEGEGVRAAETDDGAAVRADAEHRHLLMAVRQLG